MSDASLNAISVLLIIALAYFFKRLHFLSIDTAKNLSFVVMYLTLPCAILTSANGMTFDVSLLGILALSATVNCFLLIIAFFFSHGPKQRMFSMINITCFNIGNFIIPFMQHTMSPRAFLALCMFDVINALFCFGGSYSIALFFNRKYFPEQKVNIRSILKEMSKSMSFHVYAFVLVLAAYGVTIPEPIIYPCKIIGGANTVLCFMIIGIALSFNITWEQFKNVLHSWIIRYVCCAFMAVVVWFCVPYDAEVRIIIMIILVAPMASIAPIITMRALPEYAEEAADLNTISILTSIVFVTLMNSITAGLV